jgi:hypothetical protein
MQEKRDFKNVPVQLVQLPWSFHKLLNAPPIGLDNGHFGPRQQQTTQNN